MFCVVVRAHKVYTQTETDTHTEIDTDNQTIRQAENGQTDKQIDR